MQFIKAVFVLWDQLQLIEEVRKILSNCPGDTIALEKNAPKVKESAQNVSPLAATLCQKVDVALEKMKPFGGS